MPVRILEDHVVNQIAAGEVVERPASVLRELFQNALDAGATAVEVSLRAGGIALVRVADNGSGMNRTDAMMALERHATSKIHRAEDLQTIGTLGFRGEALPSIAAVSRFELRTREPASEAGTRIRVEGGTLRDVSEVGCAPGTEVDVRSLFFNLPARRKFLRTRTTELNHCLAIATREALIRPGLDLVVRHEDREVLRAPPAPDLEQRVEAVLGDSARGLLPVEAAGAAIRVVGRVSPVGVHRSTAASSVYLYVNGRYVQDPLLRRAVYEAYRGRVPRGRYPLVVLDVRLPPERVDVNVHPTKTEVRFSDPRATGIELTEALRAVLDAAGAGAIRLDPTLASSRPGPLFARPLEPTSEPLFPVEPSPPRAGVPAHPDDDLRYPTPRPEAPPLAAESEPTEPEDEPEDEPAAPVALAWRRLTPVGGLAQRWLVCTGEDGLAIVDTVAAIRALWRAEARAGARPLGAAQRLLAPARVRLGRAEADAIETATDALGELGVVVDRFAPVEVAVRSLPEELGEVELEPLLTALAAAWSRGGADALVDALFEVGAQHHPFPEDRHAQRTLLAVLDEVGLALEPPLLGRWTAEELARRVRGGR